MFNPELKASNILDFNLEKYENLAIKLAKINKDNIEIELSELPAYYAYYHGLMIRMKSELDKAEFISETYQSEVRSKIKTEFLKIGSKINDKLLEDKVNTDNNYKDLYNTVIKYEEIYGLLKSICLTLDHKKDMLVQLSANRRMETKLHT